MQSGKNSKLGSYILAFLFAIIALTGIAKTISNPLGQKQKIEEKSTILEAKPADTVHRINYSKYMLNIVFISGIIIVVIVFGAKWYKKVAVRKTGLNLNMKIKGRQYISPKHSIILVNIDNRNLLLGLTDSSINYLTEIHDLPDEDQTESNPENPAFSFREILNKMKLNTLGK